MLKNYLKIAIRNLHKHKGYAVINIGGLAIGMACCLLILLFVRHESRYDRFHENGDRIVRLGMTFSEMASFARIPSPTAPLFAENHPEIEQAIRLSKVNVVFQHNSELIKEARFFYADANVFDVFTFPLLQGDPATALNEPNTLVLSESAAQKYFGDQPAIGQSLILNTGTVFNITGIAKNVPSQAHLRFDFLASYSTLPEPENVFQNQDYTYFLLTDPEAATSLQKKLTALTSGPMEEMTPQLGGWAVKDMKLFLQPLFDIHLHSNLGGEVQPTTDIRYLYIYTAIALFILLIACINYMNLATARSTRRSREVGMRKVLGAHRQQVMRQFLSESMLLSLIAVAFAAMLADLVLPLFNSLTDKEIRFDLFTDGAPGLLILGMTLVVGLVSGSYPALFLSRFRPVQVLKGAGLNRHATPRLRKTLVVFQFTISIALIIGTATIQYQLDYIRTKRLGYDTEQIVTIPLTRLDTGQRATFKQEALKVPGILKASLASGFPHIGMTSTREHEGEKIKVQFLTVDHDYLETMGMEMVEGRPLSEAFPSDAETAVLVNETAIRLLDLQDKMGSNVNLRMGNGEEDVLIGVVKDFHTATLHEPIIPTVLSINESMQRSLVMRLQPKDIPATLAALESLWIQFAPKHPFTYHFLDEWLNDLYLNEQRQGKLFGTFSTLAIFIACLGLFGLAAFMAEQRTKEVGIRKVLGASTSNLIMLLSRDFVKLVVIALVCAAPIAYIAMERWLEAFAYRIDLGVGTFALAGILAIVIALGAVSYQAIKAALSNPVDSLRYE